MDRENLRPTSKKLHVNSILQSIKHDATPHQHKENIVIPKQYSNCSNTTENIRGF